jgi:hypothetical protein
MILSLGTKGGTQTWQNPADLIAHYNIELLG